MDTTIDTWLIGQHLFAFLVGQLGQKLSALCALGVMHHERPVQATNPTKGPVQAINPTKTCS